VELTAFQSAEKGVRYTDLAYSPENGLIAVGDDKGGISLWDVTNMTKKGTLKSNAAIQALAFGADGSVLASASWDSKQPNKLNTIALWDTNTGEKRLEPTYTRRIQSLRFSPDGTKLAGGSGETGSNVEFNIYLWDTSTAEELVTLKGHEAIVNSMHFSADGTQLISASNDGTLRLWDTAGKSTHTVFKYDFPLPDNPDQPMYGSWTGTGTVTGRTGIYLVDFTISDDGTKVLSSLLFEGNSIHFGFGATIQNGAFTWKITTGTSSIQLDGKFVSQTRLEGTLKSGSISGTWTARPAKTLAREAIFTPDGKHLISVHANSRLLIWDLAQESVTTVVKGSEVNEGMNSVVLTSDGSAVITVGGKLRIWSGGDAGSLFESEKLKSSGSQLALSADGKLLLWLDSTGFVRVWGVPSK
jgi:WD40 repeat protein